MRTGVPRATRSSFDNAQPHHQRQPRPPGGSPDGGDNVVYNPQSTGKAYYKDLRGRFGTAPYRRVVVAGYGHLDTWMGKRSNVDVYPSARGHFERLVNGAMRNAILN
ncbi:hypothetical protein B0H17DRAFT_1209789 [Mycena rosella]|uniref:Uncharacterized protein n=1 Tax=Mycena rosella TaxID=1033263 RepID=A0AAD7D1G3_MYCRO|nr:hypothetical protein B0H17DRAFT_1209789 [Mycena rosella]